MSYILSKELYSDCVAESAILNAEHWIELYGKKGYRANHGGMVDLENSGGFVYFTLRTPENYLAGHAGFMLINSPIYGMWIALDAFYYIKPDHRGHMGMCRLLKFSGDYLTSHGIERVLLSGKTALALTPIIERSGFVKGGDLYSYVRK